ncbi:MAG: D-aminoacyl-tRNA deacylase [Chloroflexota bacterium]
MKALLQRVTSGSVTVEEKIVGQIQAGFVVLLGVTHTDTHDDVAQLVKKIIHLRVFADDQGKMNRSLLDVDGEALVVSQFTLYADTRKGRRPSYVNAASPDIASPLVDEFVKVLRQSGVKKVETGIFGAEMQVDIQNDGPVTIMLETPS